MNDQIAQLQSQLTDLTSQFQQLFNSSTIPRNVETAFATRLGTGTQSFQFPIGALYFNTTNVNPTTELGYGIWSLYGQGQMPVCYKSGDTSFGTMAATGGEKTHTLTTTEMPAHNHPVDSVSGSTGSGFNVPSFGSNYSPNYSAAPTWTTENTGGGGAHNNLPPFVVVAIWNRTA